MAEFFVLWARYTKLGAPAQFDDYKYISHRFVNDYKGGSHSKIKSCEFSELGEGG